MTIDGQPYALKWYHKHLASKDQRKRLEELVQMSPPDGRFLWPIAIAEAKKGGFGYVMPLRDNRFASLYALMRNQVSPTFRTLCKTGFELASSYRALHSRGLCYRDIQFGNVFFDANTGEVVICDNDNVAAENQKYHGVSGTLGFTAPELVEQTAFPSIKTDLWSLSTLLFYILMVHHPLEGKKESAIKCLDQKAKERLYGRDALFIFDPNDKSNEPDPRFHQNALIYWHLYPTLIRDLFTRAFTSGKGDPYSRVRETEWMDAMVILSDSIVYGPTGKQNFYNRDTLKSSGALTCWHCGQPIKLPPRLGLPKHVVMLNHDTMLYPHHLEPQKTYDFSTPLGAVVKHPTDPNVWGLQNRSGRNWVSTPRGGSPKDVESGRSVTLAEGTKINFGDVVGEIRL